MSASLLHAVVVVGLLAPLFSSAWAYPVAPDSLWGLSRRAQLVVLAEVSDIEMPPAQLRILEVWKGPKRTQVQVEFDADVICPAPPTYVPGRRVVAFLGEDKGKWHTLGLASGARQVPDAAAEEAYRVAVREALAAWSRGGGDAERLDWGIRVSAFSETRWDGLRGLTSLGRPLTPAQQEQLAQNFIAAPVLDVTLPMTLEVLAPYRSARLDAVMASALEELLGADDPESPYGTEPLWTVRALDLLAARLGRASSQPPRTGPSVFKAVIKERKRGAQDAQREYARRMRREWRDLKRELHLAPAPLPRHPAPPARDFLIEDLLEPGVGH